MRNPYLDPPEIKNPYLNTSMDNESTTTQLSPLRQKLLDRFRKGIKAEVGDPISQLEEASQEGTPDSLLRTGILSAAQGALAIPEGISRLGGMLGSNWLRDRADNIKKFRTGITPTADPNNPNLQATAATIGDLLGTLLPAAKVQQVATQGLKGLAAKIPSKNAAKALSAIASASQATKNAATKLGASPTSAAILGKAVANIPTEVGGGIVAQGLTDPESLTTPKGVGLSLGLGLAGSLISARGIKTVDDELVKIKGNLPQEVQNILNQIEFEPDRSSLPTVGQLHTKIRTELIDKNYPLLQAEREIAGPDLNVNNSPYAAAQLAAGSTGRADQFLRFKPFIEDADGNIQFRDDVKPFEQVLDELGPDNIDHFRALSIAQRGMDRGIFNQPERTWNPETEAYETKIVPRPAPIDIGISVHDKIKTVANAPPLIKLAVEDAAKFRQSVLDYAVSKDLVSKESADLFKQLYENYVSFARAFNSKEPIKEGSKSLGVWGQIKKLSGSDRKFLDPIFTTVDNTRRIFRAAARNDVALKLANLADQNPQVAEGLMQRVTSKDIYTSDKLRTTMDNLKEVAAESGMQMSDKSAMEIAMKMGDLQLDQTSNTLNVWRNGVIESYKVSPDIAKVFNSFGGKELGLLTRLLALPAQGLRAGITENPVFAMFNFMRDQWDASIQSQYGFSILKGDGLKGLKEAIKNGDIRQEFLASGGGFSGLTGSKGYTDAQAFRNILPQTLGEKTINTIKHPFQALRALSRPFEEAARLGEFMKAKQAGASSMEAVLAARRVTTDFAQIGGSMQSLAHMTAFLNPAIQGMDRAFDEIGNNPTNLALKGFSAVTIPSILLWAANRNDEEIRNLRGGTNGHLYWFIRMPDGEITKLPKPIFWGQIFGTSWESTLDKWLNSDPVTAEQFADNLIQSAKMNVIPTGLQTAMNIWANEDANSGIPIIPLRQQGISPLHQGTDNTTDAAKVVSKLVNKYTGLELSPIHIDYTWNQSTGTIGRELAGLTSDRPREYKADIPFLGRFFAKYPTQAVEPIRTFYNDAGKIEEVMNTVKYLSENDALKLEPYITSHLKEFELASMYAEAKEQLADMREGMNQIKAIPKEEMSDKEKQELLDQYALDMITVTKEINQAARMIKGKK